MEKMEKHQETKLITSKEVLSKTGISRATLNNYIKMGILPRPVVQKAGEDMQGVKQIGYFPESAVWRIEVVKRLKREGEPMDKIARQFAGDASIVEMFPDAEEHERPDSGPDSGSEKPKQDERVSVKGMERDKTFREESRRGQNLRFSERKNDLKLTITDMDFPAYLISHNFEVEWVNKKAEEKIFNLPVSSIDDVESRNIFKLFFSLEFHSNLENWKDIISFHMPFVKHRYDKKSLSKIFRGISDSEVRFLEDFYRDEDQVGESPASHTPIQLRMKDGEVEYLHIYCMRFREGIFFLYVPTDRQTNDVMEYLSKRELVINELMKHRMPALVSLCVLVADLQDSVKISAELLPGEYFALINDLWDTLAGCFEKFGGIYGKHAGDGMLYYFIKKPGTDYITNAVDCALELRKRMKEFSSQWKIKKGWNDDMYLNIGINEGQEFFGTIRSAPTVEFTALGDSINYAGRLSDFARYGEIWTTKSVVSKMDGEKLKDIQFGVNRMVHGRSQFSQNAFSRVIDLIDENDKNYGKFIDIANLAVTQIMQKQEV